MKTTFTTIAAALMLIAFTANIYGQNTDLPFYQKGTTGWYKMKTDARLSVKELLEKHTSDLNLSQWDEFKSYHSETDELGITHYRFQQYHRGIPVENGILLIHEKWGKVVTFNGNWSKNLNLSTNPAFSDEQAIEKALTLLPAERYM